MRKLRLSPLWCSTFWASASQFHENTKEERTNRNPPTGGIGLKFLIQSHQKFEEGWKSMYTLLPFPSFQKYDEMWIYLTKRGETA